MRRSMSLLGADGLLVPRLRLESKNMEPLLDGGNGRIQKDLFTWLLGSGGGRSRVSSGEGRITFLLFRSLHPSAGGPARRMPAACCSRRPWANGRARLRAPGGRIHGPISYYVVGPNHCSVH